MFKSNMPACRSRSPRSSDWACRVIGPHLRNPVCPQSGAVGSVAGLVRERNITQLSRVWHRLGQDGNVRSVQPSVT
jgi:hypothetical protein